MTSLSQVESKNINNNTDATEASTEKISDISKLLKIVAGLRGQLEKVGKLEGGVVQLNFLEAEKLAKQLAVAVEKKLPTKNTNSTEQLFQTVRKKLREITTLMRQAPDLDTLLATTVTEIQKTISCDRSLLYRFNSPHKGIVLAESKTKGWTPAFSETIPATTFGLEEKEDYLQQEVAMVEMDENSSVTPYQKQLLERFQVKSSLSLPILKDGEVWGLLVVQQCDGARHWGETELMLLFQVACELTIGLQRSEFVSQLQELARGEEVLNQLIEEIRESTNLDADLGNILKTTLKEMRSLIETDRVGIYHFHSDSSGKFIAESVGAGWTPLVKSDDTSTHKLDSETIDLLAEHFENGESFAVDDIHNGGFNSILEECEAKAYALAPIFQGNMLWGTIGTYQHSSERHWKDSDLRLLQQIGNHLGMALQQAETLERMKTEIWKQAKAKKRQRTVTKVIQQIGESSEIETIFQTTVKEMQSLLEADRVGIYRFNSDYSGEFIAESTGAGITSLLHAPHGFNNASDCNAINSLAVPRNKPVIADTYIQQTKGGRFRHRETSIVDDIYKANLNPCYLEVLEECQVKAYVVVPVFEGDKLWGLLGVYQNSAPRKWEESEVSSIAQIASGLGVALKEARYIEELKRQSQQQTEATHREKTKATIIDKIRSSSNIDEIFKVATQEVRKVLKTDRTVVYQFNPDWSGQVVAESVGSGWVSLLIEQSKDEVLSGDRTNHDRCILRKWSEGDIIETDSYLQKTKGGRYVRGQKVTCVNDIYSANFPDCYVESLEKYQAKAYTIVPIFREKKLWGLLGAYQNSETRQWQESECDLMMQIADQLAIALKQADYIEELKRQSQQQAEAAEREKTKATIIDKIRSSSNIDDIFKVATQEVRKVLKTDRTVVYQFNPDWSGQVVAESVGSGWVSLLIEQSKDEVLSGDRTSNERCILRKWSEGDIIETDSYLQKTKGGRYVRGQKVTCVNDIYTANFPDCYVESLEKYQVKAYTIVPIFREKKLWGLLGAYQNSETRQWQESESDLMIQIADQLAIALKQADYIEELKSQSQQQAEAAEREKTKATIIDKIRSSSNIDDIFKVATQEVRKVLKTDRTVVYQFNPDWSGQVVAESVGSGWVSLLIEQSKDEVLSGDRTSNERCILRKWSEGDIVEPDAFLKSTKGGRYVRGQKVTCVEDIYTADFPACYVESLEKYQAKAYTIAPIFCEDKLWGLLGTYQNSGTRNWQESESDLMMQIASQLGIALQRSQYLQQIQAQSAQLAEALQQNKAGKELLQSNAMQLLSAVRPALDGDLTVRAPITEDEMGTIAGAYNNTLQTLGKIIAQVQTAVGTSRRNFSQ